MKKLLILLGIIIAISGTINTLITQRQVEPFALPTVQTVNTHNPKAAAHTRLTGVGDESFVAHQLDLVAAMGTPWIVELFPWAYAQPRSQYGYDWRGFDMVIDHAHTRGIAVIARLDIVPAWARPTDRSDRFLAPYMYTAYRDYVVAFVQRYQHRGVTHIIICNEPNLQFEWGGQRPDPEAYAQLLAAVYPAVKQAAPDVTVIAGALSPGETLGDHAEVRLGDREYLTRFLAAGGGQFMDAWGVHAYGGQLPPDDPPRWDVVNLRRVELIHQLLNSYVNKPIYITEAGWNDAPRWQLAVTPAQRIRWSIAAYQQALQWSWLKVFTLWQFGLPAPTHTYQDGWLLVAGDGTPRVIYDELRQALTQTPP